MAYEDGDWYQHLVDQSRTDYIYTLIYCYLKPDWEPRHNLDFVVLQKDQLPPEKFPEGIPASHIALPIPKEKYSFPGDNYILLDNEHLTDYLEAAREMKIVEDKEGRQFIELVFKKKEKKQNAVFSIQPEIDIKTITPQTLPKQEDALYVAYELLRTHSDKKRALEYARIAEDFLDKRKVYINEMSEIGLLNIEHKMVGYNIVSMVYAWNGLISDAAIIDSQYLFHPNLWDRLEATIEPYLEMLMAMGETEYVKNIFKDTAFRKRFLAHYEAFVSLFISDVFPLTKQYEVFGIINRVNHSKEIYRKG